MVYLLCFNKKFKHAQHYIGFVDGAHRLDARMTKHKKGQGSKLLAAVMKAGMSFVIARTWANGDRNFERMLKNRKNAKYLCPCCSAKPSIIDMVMIDTETCGLDASSSFTSTITSTPVNTGDSFDPTIPYTGPITQIENKLP